MVSVRLTVLDARAYADRHALARRIRAAEADVACVFGAPDGLRWRAKCAAIGRESGLVTVVGGRTGGGTLLLSTLGVDVAATDTVGLGGSRMHPRGAAAAALVRLGSRFVLAGASFASDSRHASAEGVVRAADRLGDGAPAVFAVHDAGPAAALVLQNDRVQAVPGVFVDARVGIEQATADVLTLSLPDT